MSRLGIIAGSGSLPLLLAAAARDQGRDFFVLCLQGQADLKQYSSFPHAVTRLGETARTINTLKSAGVDQLVMAGAVRRPALSELKPDLRTMRLFARLGFSAVGDDALLKAVMSEFEGEGFQVVGAHEILPSLLTPFSVLTSEHPSPENNADIAAGMKVAKTLGALDVGQAAVVQQGIVLGVEAVEGTDALLSRASGLRRKGRGGVLVKASKPQQERRLDLPTIGEKTVLNAYKAGLEGIAIEAGASMIVNRDEAVALADRLGLFIAGVSP